jgi:hypothetical protein
MPKAPAHVNNAGCLGNHVTVQKYHGRFSIARLGYDRFHLASSPYPFGTCFHGSSAHGSGTDAGAHQHPFAHASCICQLFFASDILDFSSCFAALGFVARALLHLVVCSSSLYIVTLPSSRRHDTFLRIYTHMASRRRYGMGGGSVPVAARCGKRGERDCFDSFRFGTCMQCRSFLCADWGLAGRSASVDATPSSRGIGSLLWDGMTWDNRLHSGHELVWHRYQVCIFKYVEMLMLRFAVAAAAS